jgi:ribosomal protein S6--L-glutamate ligase
MRFGILGWDCAEFESLHLMEVGRAAGHHMTLFTLDDVSWGQTGDGYGVLVAGEPAAELAVIISRAMLRRDERWRPDLERLTLLSNLPGTPMLDPAAEYVAAESKFIQIQRLRNAGLPVLPTVYCASVDDVERAVKSWGDTVVKPSFGWEGNDVERLWAAEKLPDTVAVLLARHGSLLAQPYIPHPEGDTRVTVVDGEVVLTFRRIPRGGGWRSNLAQGSRPEPVTPSTELVDLALRATEAMGITTAGVDIMRRGDGHVIVEVNNAPGWHPITPAEEAKVPTALIRFAERVATRQGLIRTSS